MSTNANLTSRRFRDRASQIDATNEQEGEANAVSGDFAVGGALTVTGNVGFYGTAAAAQPAAYTLTYSTADRTLAAPTATAVTDGDIGGTANGALEAVGATNSGDVSGAIENNFKELQAVTAALIADNLDLRQSIAALVADLQSVGLLQ